MPPNGDLLNPAEAEGALRGNISCQARRPIHHVNMKSGGIGSWATGKFVVRDKMRPGDRLTNLFADTMMEDEDLYRFLHDAVEDIGGDLVIIADGRDPWQVFFDVRYLGNTRIDPCSFHLKRKLMREWLEANCDPASTVCYIGIDAGEAHRYEKSKRYWEPWVVEAPLIDAGILFRQTLFDMLADTGIAAPALYLTDPPSPHNNCGGFCIKGGIDHFILLLTSKPERYAYHERREGQLRRYLGHTDECRAINSPPGEWASPEREAWLDHPGCACPIRDVSIMRDRSAKIIARRVGLTLGDCTRVIKEDGTKGWWIVTATGEPLPAMLPLTMRRLRERIERGLETGSDGQDIGGCNCVNPDAEIDAEIVNLGIPTMREAS